MFGIMPDENLTLAGESARHKHLSACGAAAITLGTAIGKTTRAIHCNTAGTATLYFPDGSTANVVLVAGMTYDYAVTRADNVSGNPALVALF